LCFDRPYVLDAIGTTITFSTITFIDAIVTTTIWRRHYTTTTIDVVGGTHAGTYASTYATHMCN
jgi:hypothetical protein